MSLSLPRRGGEEKPTVGRLDDLLWVGRPTYSRFFRRPTVGYRRGALRYSLQTGSREVGRRAWRRVEVLASVGGFPFMGESRDSHIVRISALWFLEGGGAKRRGTRTRLVCLPSGE